MLARHAVLSQETSTASREVGQEIFTENVKKNNGDEMVSEEADDCKTHILKRLGDYGVTNILRISI